MSAEISYLMEKIRSSKDVHSTDYLALVALLDLLTSQDKTS